LLFAVGNAYATEETVVLNVAVATNFVSVLEKLKAKFESNHSGRISISAGSTGKLYAQIRQGAPYDIFLSADQYRPELLKNGGFVFEEHHFTYAAGALVLWHPNFENPRKTMALAHHNPQHRLGNAEIITKRLQKATSIALANPRLAPYGLAAQQILKNLNYSITGKNHLVRAENIGQTFALVATGNASVGFIALAQALEQNLSPTSLTPLPQDLYQPIYQDAVLLHRGAVKQSALRFFEFLQSSSAKKIIESSGFLATPEV
jgi:molybdate transport system substrate-binding protein